MKKLLVVIALLVGIALLLYAIDKYGENGYSTWSEKENIVSSDSISVTGAGVSGALLPYSEWAR